MDFPEPDFIPSTFKPGAREKFIEQFSDPRILDRLQEINIKRRNLQSPDGLPYIYYYDPSADNVYLYSWGSSNDWEIKPGILHMLLAMKHEREQSVCPHCKGTGLKS
jgi:hypothetical protein